MAQRKDATRRNRPDSLSMRPAKRWRIVLSLLIVVQLLAVVAEPFRFFTNSTRGTSPLADVPRSWLAPYIEFAYLSHGYFFFAPEPGPTHLLECRLTLDSGKHARLTFPDRNVQWPRLLYHRHFMLAESLHQLWIMPVRAEEFADDPRLLRDWTSERKRFEDVRGSMVRHLSGRHNASNVSIERLEHRLPSSDEVLVQGMQLNDKSFYVTLPDAPFDDSSLPPPGGGNVDSPARSLESIRSSVPAEPPQ